MPPFNENYYLTTSLQHDYNKKNKVYVTEEEEEPFEKSLYRNSKVHRIVLGEQIKNTKVEWYKWYTINLKFVTEMGLPALDQHGATTNNVNFQLLEKKENKKEHHSYSYFSQSTFLNIQYRSSIPSDPWRNSQAGTFNLEYRVIPNKSNSSSRGDHKDEFYIRVFVDNEKSLSLCIGPFQHQHQQQQQKLNVNKGSINFFWVDCYESARIYRAIPLVDEKSFSLLQEVWENGTPGKLWDSALIMNYMFNQLFKTNKNFLSGKRVLDLSAGVGSIGLSIAQSCQVHSVDYPPVVVMTDLEEALPLIKSNQYLNNIPSNNNLLIQILKWGSTQDIEQVMSGYAFDYIFASDVLYNTIDFPALISTLRQLTFQNKQTIIFMGYKPRGLKKYEENMFFNGCKVYFDISLVTANDFMQELDSFGGSYHNSHLNSTILEETCVRLYKLTRR